MVASPLGPLGRGCAGARQDLLTSGERERLKLLERENRELRKANEDLGVRLGVFAISCSAPFTATGPNELWVADLTYLRCWEGLVFFAFVIDAFSRRVVGWQFAAQMRTDLVLDALRMALHQRGPGADVELVHHRAAAVSTQASTTPRRSPTTACSRA